MAGSPGRLLLCLLAFCLAGSSTVGGQKVSVRQSQGVIQVFRPCWPTVGAGRECTQIGHSSGDTWYVWPSLSSLEDLAVVSISLG